MVLLTACDPSMHGMSGAGASSAPRDFAGWVGSLPVGERMEYRGTDGFAPKSARVLEVYDAASGETCRKFVEFVDEQEAGTVQTACRTESGTWILLRPLSHQTMMPTLTQPGAQSSEIKAPMPTAEPQPQHLLPQTLEKPAPTPLPVLQPAASPVVLEGES